MGQGSFVARFCKWFVLNVRKLEMGGDCKSG
jgi:hypothetical protein